MKVRQGRSSRWVDAPVDFSTLSSEYIGILYEGLLDFELKQAAENDPVIFLAVGDQPALTLSQLETMEDKDIKQLFEALKKKTRPVTTATKKAKTTQRKLPTSMKAMTAPTKKSNPAKTKSKKTQTLAMIAVKS